jgi:LPXTG-motif cell wall-anchored protein
LQRAIASRDEMVMPTTTSAATIGEDRHDAQCARKGVSPLKNPKPGIAMVGIALVIAIGVAAGRTADAATPTIGLGTAASFSVLAGTPAVTNTGATTINRDVGIHPAAAVTGFPPGIVGGTIHAGDATALQAQTDLGLAYVDAAGRPVTAVHGALGGLTLVSGVYNAGGVTLDLTGTLTLDGQSDPNAVWIFQATSDLVTASTSSVSLINGASPCNVFWQVTSSATLGSGSTFVGTILAQTSITLASGVTVNGRALARSGDVTLINDTFISTACQTVLIPPTRPPFTIAPSVAPTVAPTRAPVATATPIAASTPTPAAAGTVTPAVAALQTLPSTSTDEPISPLVLLGIALAGIGVLVLRRPLGNRSA